MKDLEMEIFIAISKNKTEKGPTRTTETTSRTTKDIATRYSRKADKEPNSEVSSIGDRTKALSKLFYIKWKTS